MTRGDIEGHPSSAVAILPILVSTTILSGAIPQTLGYVLTGLSLVAIAAIYLHDQGYILQIRKSLFIWIAGYLAGLTVLLVVAPTNQLPLYLGSTVVVFLVYFYLAPSSILSDRDRFSYLFCLLATFLVMFGILELLIEHTYGINYVTVADPILGIDGLRIRSIFWNSNVFGFFMLVALLLTLYRLDAGLQTPKGLVAMNAIGFVLAGSESTYLGFAAALGVYAIIHGLAYVVSLGLIGLFAFLVAWRVGYPQSFIESGLNNRLYLWEAGLRRLAESPLLGVRWKDVSSEILPYVSEKATARETAGPHNTYIFGLLNLGLVVGMFYLSIFFSAVLSSFQLKKDPWGTHLCAVILAMAIDLFFRSQTIGGMSTTSLLIAIYIGLIHRTYMAESSDSHFSGATNRY